MRKRARSAAGGRVRRVTNLSLDPVLRAGAERVAEVLKLPLSRTVDLALRFLFESDQSVKEILAAPEHTDAQARKVAGSKPTRNSKKKVDFSP